MQVDFTSPKYGRHTKGSLRDVTPGPGAPAPEGGGNRKTSYQERRLEMFVTARDAHAPHAHRQKVYIATARSPRYDEKEATADAQEAARNSSALVGAEHPTTQQRKGTAAEGGTKCASEYKTSWILACEPSSIVHTAPKTTTHNG